MDDDKNLGIKDAELLDLIKRELLTGFHAEGVMATIRQNRIAQANARLQSSMIEGVGQRTMSIDPTVYHFWNHVERGCWKDKAFVNRFLKLHPECRAPAAIRKIQVINQYESHKVKGERRKTEIRGQRTENRGSLIAA